MNYNCTTHNGGEKVRPITETEIDKAMRREELRRIARNERDRELNRPGIIWTLIQLIVGLYLLKLLFFSAPFSLAGTAIGVAAALCWLLFLFSERL